MPAFEDKRTPEEKEERSRLCALPFRMVIEDVFDVKGRGIIITGRVKTGVLREDDPIIIMGEGNPIQAHAMRFEIFGHIDYIEPGDNIGILLSKDITKEQIKPGMIVTTEGI